MEHLINKEVKEVNMINANQDELMENKSHQTDSITFSKTLLVWLIIQVGLMKYTRCKTSCCLDIVPPFV